MAAWQGSYKGQEKLSTHLRKKRVWTSLLAALEAMMKAAMKAWMERKQEEEVFIEEVGIIAGVAIISPYTHSCPRVTILFTWQVVVAKGALV